MTLIEVQQGTAEWLQMRVGCVTASRVADVMATLKGKGEAAARKNYKSAIMCEMLTGRAAGNYVSPSMQWGLDNEIFARNTYEIKMECVEPGGFALHDNIPRFGASPDGLVGEYGLVEFKCPTTATHLDYISEGIVPAEYCWQMYAQMSCAGRKWCDFVSFDPRLPEKFQFFVRRLERNEEKIAQMEEEVRKFLFEVVEQVKLLEKATLIDVNEERIPDYCRGGLSVTAQRRKKPSAKASSQTKGVSLAGPLTEHSMNYWLETISESDMMLLWKGLVGSAKGAGKPIHWLRMVSGTTQKAGLAGGVIAYTTPYGFVLSFIEKST
jgi:putative phage-type endonuclease